jgi:ADP-ribosyltransferase exoenzyme
MSETDTYVVMAEVQVAPHVRVQGGKVVAVKGHTRTVTSFNLDQGAEAEAWGEKQYGEWAESLSGKQKEILSRYKVMGYRWVNSILRGTAEAQRKEWNEGEGYEDITKQDLKDMADEIQPVLDAVMEAAPRVPEDVVVYRGTIKQDFEVGQEFDDLAYASTSLTRERADDFASWQTERSEWDEEDGPPQPPGVVAEILVHKGTKGMYIDAVGEGLAEKEMLLDRGLRYRVASVEPLLLEVIS